MKGVDVKVEILVKGIGPLRNDEVYVTDEQHAEAVGRHLKEVLVEYGYVPFEGEDSVVILSASVPPKAWQPK